MYLAPHAIEPALLRERKRKLQGEICGRELTSEEGVGGEGKR